MGVRGDEERRDGRREFLFRLVATFALAAGLLAIWHLSSFVLLVFGAILFAIFLNAPAGWLHRRAGIPYRAALTIVILLFFGALVGGVWLFAPHVGSQIVQLSQELPKAIDRLVGAVRQRPWMEPILQQAPDLDQMLSGSKGMLSRVSQFIFGTIDAFTALLVVLFAGIFFAFSPNTYVNGVLHLIRKPSREPAREVLNKMACTLRHWLLGQFLAMVVIGLATWAGLALLGVRLSAGLGLLAGLLEFIPTFGPIMAAIPAILIALMEDPQKALYVALFYTGLQFAENHFLVPIIQRRAVELPPALSILAILLLATLFGFLGLLLAIPLTAAIFVLVKETYVKRTLEDPVD